MRCPATARIAFVVALTGGCAFHSPITQAPSSVTQASSSTSQARSSARQAAVPIEATPLVREQRIEVIVRSYVNDVRFRLFDAAVGFVEPDLRSEFRVATEYLRTIRFTGVTIEQVEIDEPGTTAIATVRWRGHWLSSPFERELRTTQRWRRDEPSQKWYVTPELEALGANLEQIRRAPAASMPPR
jgi:hypothetical protein